ncbi:MAG: hypothetical protein FWF03_00560 [Defluviitaleaceae bacterium]|nr:hypothetical protein [Defluviitaleaceae bacterium]
MKKELEFNVPFSGFAGTTFLNCFASVCAFFEKLPAEQEKYFFLFGAMCGHSSLRFRYDGAPTEMEKLISVRDFYDCGGDYAMEFLFGFAGYDYGQMVNPADFKEEIISSIDAGKPVIVGTKGAADQYRVITGYDGDGLISPGYANAQRPPEAPPKYEDIEVLYVFGQKNTPKFGFVDGLKRIAHVMERNIGENTWGTYLEKFRSYPETPDSFIRIGADEKKARIARLQKSMWDVMNTHNFSEVFRNCLHDDLKNPALDELRHEIGGPRYGYTHDLSAALITLADQADWSHYYAHYYGEMIELTLRQIAENDLRVHEAIKKMIEILN